MVIRGHQYSLEVIRDHQSSSAHLPSGPQSTLEKGGGGDEEADALLTDEGLREAAAKRMHRWIQGQLLDYILHIIDEPEVKYSTFPQNAGSHLQLTSPSLELAGASACARPS